MAQDCFPGVRSCIYVPRNVWGIILCNYLIVYWLLLYENEFISQGLVVLLCRSGVPVAHTDAVSEAQIVHQLKVISFSWRLPSPHAIGTGMSKWKPCSMQSWYGTVARYRVSVSQPEMRLKTAISETTCHRQSFYVSGHTIAVAIENLRTKLIQSSCTTGSDRLSWKVNCERVCALDVNRNRWNPYSGTTKFR